MGLRRVVATTPAPAATDPHPELPERIRPGHAADVARVRTFLSRVDPTVLAVALAQLAEEHPAADTLLAALALAVEAAHLRQPTPRDDYTGGRYHRPNPLPAYSDLQRRRYPPTGNRDLWIKYGPDGPPESEIGGVA